MMTTTTTHLIPHLRQAERELRSHSALSHTAFTTQNQELVLDSCEALPAIMGKETSIRTCMYVVIVVTFPRLK